MSNTKEQSQNDDPECECNECGLEWKIEELGAEYINPLHCEYFCPQCESKDIYFF